MTIRFGFRWPTKTIEDLIVREQAMGIFGDLVVSDFAGARTLWCGALCHGSAYLEPSVEIECHAVTPGPVPEASYLVGWLVPALLNPTGTILMVGLGPGVGVASLLYNFPELAVVAVEIDPNIIWMSREQFPLLDYYIKQGRLRIVNADVKQFIAANPHARWSSILMDAYQNDTNLYCPRKLLEDLRHHTDSLWLNVLDCIEGTRTRSFIRLLKQTGWSLGTALPVSWYEGGAQFRSGNILIGTDDIAQDQALQFIPFADLSHVHAETARLVYSTMIKESISLHSA